VCDTTTVSVLKKTLVKTQNPIKIKKPAGMSFKKKTGFFETLADRRLKGRRILFLATTAIPHSSECQTPISPNCIEFRTRSPEPFSG
jgi:hypothetical protein